MKKGFLSRFCKIQSFEVGKASTEFFLVSWFVFVIILFKIYIEDVCPCRHFWWGITFQSRGCVEWYCRHNWQTPSGKSTASSVLGYSLSSASISLGNFNQSMFYWVRFFFFFKAIQANRINYQWYFITEINSFIIC